MVNKEVNPRFLEVARRQKNPGFLEAEARKVEEFERLKEGERIKVREEIARKRIERLEGLRLENKRKEELRAYVEKLNAYEGNELETSIYAFVNHSDFSTIHNQLDTIPKLLNKWEFLLRRAYEIGGEVEVFIGSSFQNNPVNAKRELENYGIYFLCPYFRSTDRELYPKEDCVIDDEPVMTMCDGIYDQCDLFKDRAAKSATGQITLPTINRPKPKIQIPKIKVDPVDLGDLDDWWRVEGKYE